jgi:DNA-binding LacI/PurR family transcriptional regulator
VAKRRVTSRDVAKKAGVSRTTVSFVLNEVEGVRISTETRQRVLAAATELGYVPDATAQALVSRRTRIIGLVFSRSYHHLASDAFLLQIVDGLLDIVRQHGIRLILDTIENSTQKDSYLSLARAKRIDGIIISLPRTDDTELHTLAEEEFPAVLIGRLPTEHICSVDVDNRAAACVAVEHLLAQGHKRIGCITNAPPSFIAGADRLRGYHDALDKAGITHQKNLVRYGNFSPQSGYEAMSSLLNEEKKLPTAVFIASDVVAFGAMRAINEHNLKIPNDIALIGFDDVPLSRFMNPPLSTVRLPAKNIGRKAGELLFDLILHQVEPGRQVLLDTELVSRESSG